MNTAPDRTRAARWVLFGLFCLAIGAVFYQMVKDASPGESLRKIDGYAVWPKETLRVAEVLPVQDGGRIKPLSTYASFALYRLHGQRSMKIEDGQGKKVTLKPTAWLLDCLFRPDKAAEFPTFRLDNSAVVEAIGLKAGEKRDRYRYTDLLPARDKLIDLAKSYEAIEAGKRDPLQQQTIDLAYNVRGFEGLIGYLGWARAGVRMQAVAGQPERSTDLSTVMQAYPQIRAVLADAQQRGEKLPTHVLGLLEQIQDAANFSASGLFLFPPSQNGAQWHSAGDAIMGVMTGETKQAEPVIADIKKLEATARAVSKGDEPFRSHLTELRDSIVARAQANGEYRAIKLEASYNRADWFLNAFVFFLLGCFLVVGAMFWGKWFARLAWLAVAAGGVYCVIAIVQRCLIMQRPPVGNLYDTIIFIAGLRW
jgi:hypothetical protein